jgi:glutathione S-transferase
LPVIEPSALSRFGHSCKKRVPSRPGISSCVKCGDNGNRTSRNSLTRLQETGGEATELYADLRSVRAEAPVLVLYDYLPSQNAYKVRLLLSHLERPYETRLVSIFEGEGQHPDYLKINPAGAVPALQIAPGEYLAESNAILTYLAEGTSYLPAAPFARAKVLQWLFFEADYVQSTVATLRHWKMTGKDKQRDPATVGARRAGSLKVLSNLDRELSSRRFLTDSGYTIADMSVFAYVARAEEAIDLAAFPHLRAWIGRVKSQPGYLGEVHPYSIDPHSHRELA